MKIQKLVSKLTLAKETLRSLGSQDLGHAHGGGGTINPQTTSPKLTCYTCQFSVCLC
jgi:hypothetical protein